MYEYEYRQHGLWWVVLALFGLATLAAAVVTGVQGTLGPAVAVLVGLEGVMLLLFASAFAYFDVRADDECLRIRSGPLPLFRATIRYADIVRVTETRRGLLAGLGCQTMPGVWTTFRMWGTRVLQFDLSRRRTVFRVKRIYVGTADLDNLRTFLESKLPQA